MCIEIEAKIKVDSLEVIAEKLAELGAEFLSERIQKDYYFDDENETLTGTDKCLRLRRQLAGKDEKIFLTYKGAREKARYKRRQEVDIEVSEADAVKKLLSALGYKKTLVVKKSRQIWRFSGCEIALDHLPLLGKFVEIEGRNEKTIAAVQKKLGLADLQHIRESYATLMAEKLRRKN